jgi:ribonuclease HI
MSKKFYAVRIGRTPGVYRTWTECKSQVDHYPGAIFKSFQTENEAKSFYQPDTPRLILNSDPNKPLNPIPQTNRTLKIYTDGACSNNGRPNAKAGYGIFFGYQDPRNISERLPGSVQTNQRAELFAVIQALHAVSDDLDVTICTDSKYCIQAATQWMPAIFDAHLVPPDHVKAKYQNFDLMEALYRKLKSRSGKCYFEHVKGHSGVVENEYVDQLARLGANK